MKRPKLPQSHATTPVPLHDVTTPVGASKVTWGPWAALIYTIVTYFAAEYGGLLLISIYPFLHHWDYAQFQAWLTNSSVAQFLAILVIEGLTMLFIYAFLKRRRTSFQAVGWHRLPKWEDVAYMFAGFGVYFVGLNFIIFPVLKAIIPSLNFNQKQDIGFNTAHGSILVLVFISLAVLPPLVEETVVRGFLYTGLRTKLPLYQAAIITSIVFAAAHLELGSGQPALWTAAIDTFCLSLVLVYLRQKTDSLYASVGVHFLKNSIAFAALFLFHIV